MRITDAEIIVSEMQDYLREARASYERPSIEVLEVLSVLELDLADARDRLKRIRGFVV